jgi:hypothetical protein
VVENLELLHRRQSLTGDHPARKTDQDAHGKTFSCPPERKPGEIPCDEAPERLWAGPGTGDTCAVCTERIAAEETEFEVDLSSGPTLRLHRRCYTLWLDECGALR